MTLHRGEDKAPAAVGGAAETWNDGRDGVRCVGELQSDHLASGDVTAQHVPGCGEWIRGTAGDSVRRQWRPHRVQR